MVDNKIFLANGCKAIATVITYPLGIPRIVGNKLEIRAVKFGQLAKVVKREHTVDPEDLIVGDC